MKAAAGGRPPGSVRIIAGRHRRRRLPVADSPGLRPTPDRLRETLFNWLGQRVEGARCLDLFAGTGALGFEAHSRGAATVVMVEQAPAALIALREAAATLPAPDVRICAADVGTWLEGEARVFDLVFVDPPYGEAAWSDVCMQLETGGWLATGASVFLELPATAEAPPVPSGWRLERETRAGHARGLLYRTERA